jgi:hypothetical protein
MALFSPRLYVRVSWLYFLPGYNQEENKAMTLSHITREKIKP